MTEPRPMDEPEREELAELLDRAAREERAILDEARRAAGEADRALMECALERAAAESPRRPESRRRRRRWWGLLAVAAAVLLVARLAPWRETSEPGRGPEGKVLGESDLELVTPVGEVAAYGTLQWNFPIQDGITFEVTVSDPATPESPPLLHKRVEGRLSLAPGTRVTASWPDRIAIEVRALDADGESLGSPCSGSAWLSP